MKKYLLILICIILVLGCSACKTEDTTSSNVEYETNSNWEPWQ